MSEMLAMKINSFAELKANWDSYGAEPFSPETIQLALQVSSGLHDGWFVVPCGDGSIQFSRGDEEENISVWASKSLR
jgi:hypothetical protein